MATALPIQYATTSDGVRIAYVDLGDGPPVVFASNIFGDVNHLRLGWPHTSEVTNRLVALGWRVIRYDVRGMGSSDRDVEDLGLDGRVRDLTAVVRDLRLTRFALAAVDVGAPTAISYAIQNSGAVSRLVLLSPWASGARFLRIPALRSAMAAAAAGDRESGDGQSRVFSNIIVSVATQVEDAELAKLGADALHQSTSPSGYAAFNAATARIDITDFLSRVAVPTLVTHEPAFPFGSLELSQEVAAGIRGATFVIVANNSIAGRDHDENVALIDRFLRDGTAVAPSHTSNHRVGLREAGLTDREVQVLQQVASGSTNKEIADSLGVAVSTVERHLVNLYSKIGARGRADAIAFALRRGLASPP